MSFGVQFCPQKAFLALDGTGKKGTGTATGGGGDADGDEISSEGAGSLDVELVPQRRIKSNRATQFGIVRAPQAGVFVLRFDNSCVGEAEAGGGGGAETAGNVLRSSW